MSGRGLFLDLDGTLADSIGVLYEAYVAFLAEHGTRGAEAEFDELNGVRLPRAIEILVERYGLGGEHAGHVARYEALVDEAYLRVAPCAGAAELVGHARQLGFAVAVVTSGTRPRAEAWLEAAGLREDGDALVTAESVQRGKPAPDPYLLALESTGTTRERSIAVEDSKAGAAAATGAGLRTWIVSPGAPGSPPGGPADWPDVAGFVSSLHELIGRLDDV